MMPVFSTLPQAGMGVPTTRPASHRTTFAGAVLTLGVLLRIGVGNDLLNALMSYSTNGGSAVEKVHPGSWLILLSSAVLLGRLGAGPATIARRFDLASAVLLATACLLAVLTLMSDGASGLAYLLDAVICAPLVALCVHRLEIASLRRLYIWALALLLINAVIAVAEYMLRTPLIGYLQSISWEFRASALLGHPLTNGLMTATAVPFVMASSLSRTQKGGAIALMLLALLAFGARSATIGAIFAMALMYLGQNVREVREGRFSPDNFLVTNAVVILVSIAIALIVLGTNIADRLLSNALFDENARVRVESLRLISLLQPQELWFGLGSDRLLAILEADRTIPIIENFWIVYLLQFGLIGAVPLSAALIYFVVRIAPKGPVGLVGMVVFLAVASTNNSLSTKTGALVFYAALSAGFACLTRHARPTMNTVP